MNLLEPNIKKIKGVKLKSKSSWKEKLRGIKSIWELKDKENEKIIGKFVIDNKNGDTHTLYQSDDSVLINLHSIKGGFFGMKGCELRDSQDNSLGKIIRKVGLSVDTYRMVNSKDEVILESKSGFECPICDNNKNIVAELTMKRWKEDWTLNILDPNFDRIMILGFSLTLFIMIKSIIVDY